MPGYNQGKLTEGLSTIDLLVEVDVLQQMQIKFWYIKQLT